MILSPIQKHGAAKTSAQALCNCGGSSRKYLKTLIKKYRALFFFNDTAPTEIYPLSLHDALPIFVPVRTRRCEMLSRGRMLITLGPEPVLDRKSTRLNSSHQIISYAVFCLKK